MRKHVTVFPKKLDKFTAHIEIESIKNNASLRPEE